MMHKYVNWLQIKLFSLFFCVPFLLDRVTKYLVVSGQIESQEITSFFNVYLTYNQGIAWSIGSGLDGLYFVAGMFLIASILLYFAWYIRLVALHSGMLASCFLVLSGGVSNFIDRIFFIGVVDFIQLHAVDWYFPVFNVADVAITCGAICLSYFFLRDEKQ
jgi:signal peptidase II